MDNETDQEPVYIASLRFSGLQFALPGLPIKEDEWTVPPSQVDPAIRAEGRVWMKGYPSA
jgi:hypothetical protein